MHVSARPALLYVSPVSGPDQHSPTRFELLKVVKCLLNDQRPFSLFELKGLATTFAT